MIRRSYSRIKSRTSRSGPAENLSSIVYRSETNGEVASRACGLITRVDLHQSGEPGAEEVQPGPPDRAEEFHRGVELGEA